MNFTASLLALVAAAQTIVASPLLGLSTNNQLAPVPVTTLKCDGSSFQCTANLDFGDGNWVAQWSAAVFHNGLHFGVPDRKAAIAQMAMAPVPVTKLNCDGAAFQCTANLNFGDGNWVAQWNSDVFHQGFNHGETSFAPVPVNKLTCDGAAFQCNANLDFGDGNWVAQWPSNVFHSFNPTKPAFLKQ